MDRLKRRDAILFGVVAGAALLSKYYAVVLLLTCLAAACVHENRARYFRSALPYISAAIMTVLVLPHVVWAIETSAPPVAYIMARTGKGVLFSLGNGLTFLVTAALYHAVVLGLILCSGRGPREAGGGNPAVDRRRLLTVLVVAPPLLTVAFGLIFELKISTNMTLGTFPLAPLLMMQLVRRVDARRCFRLAAGFAVISALLALAVAPAVASLPFLWNDDPSTMEPRKELARAVTEIWHAHVNAPIGIVAGTDPYADAVAFYSDDKPSTFLVFSFTEAPWVTPERLRREGLLVFCRDDDGACHGRASNFFTPQMQRYTTRVQRALRTGPGMTVTFDVYVIPPQPAARAGAG